MRLRLGTLVLCSLWSMFACVDRARQPPTTIPVCSSRADTDPTPAAPVFCADPSNMAAAAVVRIVDGDTIRVTRNGVEEPVRFYGIDTPERGEPCFREATERTRELAADEVRLLPDARNRDRSDRLLRYVYTPEGLSLDAVLVSEGLAFAWRDDGQLRDELVQLEDTARRNSVGCLWSAP